MNKLVLILKGMAMGFADVIPGVSGGTIALIVGIYIQFIEAVKSLNVRWIPALFRWIGSGFNAERRRELVVALNTIHWHFLIPLAVGIVLAFGVGSVVVPYVMDRFPSETAAFFIGLILASLAVPYRQMTSRHARHFVIAVATAVVTFVVVGTKAQPAMQWGTQQSESALSFDDFMRVYPSVLSAEQLYCDSASGQRNQALHSAIVADPEQPGLAARLDGLCLALASTHDDLAAQDTLRRSENLGRKDDLNPFNSLVIPANTAVEIPMPAVWYVFLGGLIAICAMVLPGISGSFFLLILGLYHFMLSSALKGFIVTLAQGQLPVTQGGYVVVFALGCLIGLLSFARVMSRLFRDAPSGTMAALMGMMVGSLRVLWPWKIGEAHTGVRNVLPPLDIGLSGAVFAFLLGAVVVSALTWAGRRSASD